MRSDLTSLHPLLTPPPGPRPLEIFVLVQSSALANTPAIISAVIACAALFISIYSAYLANRKIHADTLFNLMRESGTESFQSAIQTVLLLPHYENAIAFNRALASEENEEVRKLKSLHILTVSEFFDRVGVLVRSKQISLDLVLATYGTRIVEAWSHLGSLLENSEFVRLKNPAIKDAKRARLLYPNNFKYIAELAEKVIPRYDDMRQAELTERFRRMSDGTATPEDYIF